VVLLRQVRVALHAARRAEARLRLVRCVAALAVAVFLHGVQTRQRR